MAARIPIRRKARTAGSKRQRLTFERLEPRLVLDGLSLVINEMMAANGTTLLDEDGDSSDWVEIYNPTNATTQNKDCFPIHCVLPPNFNSTDTRTISHLHSPCIYIVPDNVLPLFRPIQTCGYYDWVKWFPVVSLAL